MSFSPTSPPPVSAYIPCYNNAKTLAKSIAGLQNQTVPIADFFVVDDGSTDASREIAKSMGVRVIEMKINQGRGATRARAMEESRHDLVLCCDATNQLQEDFLQKALPIFEQAKTAGVCGRLVDPEISGVLRRWRARHLFRQTNILGPIRRNCLITWGTLVRRSAVLSVGNFDRKLSFGEDYELGKRLRKAGYEIFLDPALSVNTQIQNTLGQTMERYVRWNWDKPHCSLFQVFVKAQVSAIRILVPRDLKASDPLAAVISLLMPYFIFFYSRRANRRASTSIPATPSSLPHPPENQPVPPSR